MKFLLFSANWGYQTENLVLFFYPKFRSKKIAKNGPTFLPKISKNPLTLAFNSLLRPENVFFLLLPPWSPLAPWKFFCSLYRLERKKRHFFENFSLTLAFRKIVPLAPWSALYRLVPLYRLESPLSPWKKNFPFTALKNKIFTKYFSQKNRR